LTGENNWLEMWNIVQMIIDRREAPLLHIVGLTAAPFARVNLPDCEADHSSVLAVEVKMCVA